MATTNLNRLANISNKYQTPAKRVLCVCSAGMLRSPTTANVLHVEYGYNTRAAGISEEFALVPVDEVLIAWADEIVCMEASHAATLNERFELGHKDIVILGIPDSYEWGEIELINLIKKNYADSLEIYRKDR